MLRHFFWVLPALLSFSCSDPGVDAPDSIIPNLDIQAAKSFGSPLLSTYDSCDHLAADLKKAALEKMHTRFAMHLKNPPSVHVANIGTDGDMLSAPPGVPVDSPAPPAPAGNAAAPVEGVDFSGTNNQEKGVDEADIIKLDGKYFYILNKSTLTILSMLGTGELSLASVVTLPTPGTGILLNGDQALVLTSQDPSWNSPSSNNTRVDAINLGTDRTNPQLSNSYYFQGELIAARRIGSKIHVATYADFDIPGLTSYPELPHEFYRSSEAKQKSLWAKAVAETVKKNEEVLNRFDFMSLLPSRLKNSGAKLERLGLGQSDCVRTFGQQDGAENGFLSLITLSPGTDELKVDIQRVRGNRPLVYASNNQFILASPEHEPWWFFNNENLKDQTNIHRFDLSGDSLPAYQDSVRVPGTINNSFSLSEHEGYLRVATTTSPRMRFWLPQNNNANEPVQDENHLYILGDNKGKFDLVSSIEGLAPGEKIWSARFSNALGFLVTFKQMDPLFTLDLKDPLHPKVAGELKIPGVSTYLQDIGSDQLLAVGYGGDSEGLDFQTTVSLFDVSDLSQPKLADSLSFAAAENLNNSWSRVSSEANRTHLAINYFGPKGITAIPLETDRYIQNPLDPVGGQYEYISKLALVDTKAGDKLKIHGHIDHSKFYNALNSAEHRSPAIRRSYFVGDYIYAISPKAITGTRLSDMNTTASVEFP